MSRINWSNELLTGIPDIDRQHRKILEFANRIDAVKSDPSKIRPILFEMRTFIIYHFRFEETMLEDAGYPFVRAHKKVHELMIKRLTELQLRLKAGEDVSENLDSLLNNWFYKHMQNDDTAYLPIVKTYLAADETKSSIKWWKKLIRILQSYLKVI